MEITKQKVEEIISKAILELRNADEYDNGYRIKIYISDNGDLGYQIIEASSYSPDLEYIYQFPYTFPYYNNDSGGSIPYMEESGIKNPTQEQVKEWDWDMYCEDQIHSAIEILTDECIESINEVGEHELIEEN